jgi:hypothetical protein
MRESKEYELFIHGLLWGCQLKAIGEWLAAQGVPFEMEVVRAT